MNVGDIRKAIKDLPDEAAIRLYSIDEADGVGSRSVSSTGRGWLSRHLLSHAFCRRRPRGG